MIQLGTRWPFGAEPPARLAADVISTIREVEAGLADASTSGMWTLTWLEGRPVATLEQDGPGDQLVVTVDAHGAPAVRQPTDDDDEAW